SFQHPHSYNNNNYIFELNKSIKYQSELREGYIIFSISFRLPALEYLLDIKVSSLLNTALVLPVDFWGLSRHDLNSFDTICKRVSDHLISLIKPHIDNRKIDLFRLIYSSGGTLTVKELSRQVNWSSRQINRYFNDRFGISLKSYCKIIRFKSSFRQIRLGKLYPESNFTDQAHFIKDVRKFSGVPPGELAKNENDRFIQLSVLP
ncbi:AraC-like DNA-binding protein, partial [Mucilaginibacter sp. UYP25]|uniref:helix-turn-helix domain-containing protein n=1 Tax=unclassified Mucilaginibacter TaxID=2617802 RepID=UPI003392F76D